MRATTAACDQAGTYASAHALQSFLSTIATHDKKARYDVQKERSILAAATP